jgi:hypothetical protein
VAQVHAWRKTQQQQQQQAVPIHVSSACLLERACEQLPYLLSDHVALLPPDITRVCHAYRYMLVVFQRTGEGLRSHV